MIKVYNQQDLKAELKKNKTVLALFYSSWCPFCVRFVPTFDEKVANIGFESVIYVLLDDYNNPLWDNYNIPAVPTIIFFEDGKVCKRLDGKSGLGLSEKLLSIWLQESDCT
jgi:thiol-disulfide isomerase/thioredoxin